MILISAFEPFDIDPENSSQLALVALREQSGVSRVILPVSFAEAWPRLQDQIAQTHAKIVLALGQADRREKIGLEQIALNVQDAQIVDRDGAKPRGKIISPEGELALPSYIPNDKLVQKLVAAGIESEISFHAGTYVCNYLMYKLMEWAKGQEKTAGFIHIPLLLEQRLGQGRSRPMPTMTLAKAVQAVQLLVDELKKVL